MLEEYKKKRNFKKTTEPAPKAKSKAKEKSKKAKENLFVVQKHNASHLHFDFRLEIDGVLKSWAVPKGMSTNPADKRLAVETEDHPMDYGSFEGTIPEGNYGAGTVMIWDEGTFINIRETKRIPYTLKQSYEQGMIEVFLRGKKLRGAFALIRFKGQKKNWLLIKMKDEFANLKIKGENKSAKTGRTLKQIEKGEKDAETKK